MNFDDTKDPFGNLSYKECYNVTGAKQLENLRIKFEKAKSENIPRHRRKNKFVDSFINPLIQEDVFEENKGHFENMFEDVF